ncbi:MAG: preprotein translocase subunit YajC [Deltaproteobacteria bacterium]|nr:preprotein translocase subunit YajC [Deltaproteobacteria bacterium]
MPAALVFAEEGAQQSPTGISSILGYAPIAVLFVIFYFLLIRPQQKRAKEHKDMVSKIQKGDNVILSSGIHGRVHSVADDFISVEIADNVRVKVSKEAVSVRKSGE